MIVKIECPSCKTEGSMSLADVRYSGPYKCWKCKELFAIEIQDDRLISCEPLNQEEFNKILEQQQQEQEGEKKYREEMQRKKDIEDLKNKFRR